MKRLSGVPWRVPVPPDFTPRYVLRSHGRGSLELTAKQRGYLAAVIRHGNGNRAAKALGVNKSVVISGVRRALWKIRLQLRRERALALRSRE